MLANYILIAIRNIKRNLGYAAINVFGLALGITCSLILFLLIDFYTSFDKDYTDADRIYRIISIRENNGVEDYNPGVPAPFTEALRQDVNGFEEALFISYIQSGQIGINNNEENKLFQEDEGVGYVEPNYFNFFTRNLKSGSLHSFAEPNQVILSESKAKKYFGDLNPINRIITVNNTEHLKVIAVVDDFALNSNFPLDIIISYATIRTEKMEEGWGSIDSDDQCFVMLEHNGSTSSVVNQFPNFNKKYFGEERAAQMSMGLQPLSDLQYDERYSNFRGSTISHESIWAMRIIAIFLLLTACINFINLSTAVAVRRSKEIGIRKVMGSQRVQLVVQYFLETGLITIIALLASVGLAELGLIQLNTFLSTDLHINFKNSTQLIFMFIIWIGITIASGLYPAVLLSGFSPAMALKNKITNRSVGGYSLRRTLVVCQFVISQVLIIGTIIMLMQMNYFKTKDLGFSKVAIVTIPIPDAEDANKKKVLKGEIDRLGSVQQSSLCRRPPSDPSTYNARFLMDGGNEEGYRTQMKAADGEYLNLFNIEVLAGTGLSDLDTANGWVVNEKLVEVVGVGTPEGMIGRKLRFGSRELEVRGVVRDFHTVSLNSEIYPTLLYNSVRAYESLSIKLKAGHNAQTLKEIEKIWIAHYNDYLFSYNFLDDTINQFYDEERRMSTLLVVFSVIAILIGCLGLYGLIAYMANEKEKEIGVRKILGASSGQIMFIFSKELLILVFISFLVAAPLAAYVMNSWLQNFAYRIELNGMMFLGGVVTALVISFLTVGFRTIKAANSNPATTLRTE